MAKFGLSYKAVSSSEFEVTTICLRSFQLYDIDFSILL